MLGTRARFGRRSFLGGASGFLAAGLAGAFSGRVVAQETLPENLLLVDDQRPTYGGAPTVGGALRMARPTASVDDFNPASFRMDYQVAASYLDPLLRPDDVTLEPGPWLAEAWEASRDGREILYQLRDGVRWHDGTPVTADDITFSFEVYRDDANSAVVNLLALLDDAEALDDLTVRVRLLANDPTWLFNASSLPIMQAAQYREYWSAQPVGRRTLAGFDWENNVPVGSGPWRIVDWSEAGVGFARYDDYWAGAPWLKRFDLRWEQGERDRLALWRDGEIDLLWPVPANGLGETGDRTARLYATDAASVMFAAFNFDNPTSPLAGALEDPTLRQALSLAIDRAGLRDGVLAGFGRPFAAGTIAQPWANEPSVRSPRRNQTEASALLDAAGWVDYNGDGLRERADGVPLSLVAILQADGPARLARALARVKLDLAAVGVGLELQALPAEAFDARWRTSRDFDLIAYAYDLYPGFTDFDLYGSRWDIRRNAFGWNPGGYASEAADAAVDAYLAATSIEDQQRALGMLQEAVNEDLFGLWLGFPDELVLVSADLLGFQPSKIWHTANTALLWRA